MAGWKKLILANYGMNWMSRPQFISHHWTQLPAIVPIFLRRLAGVPLLSWTVRSSQEQAAALRQSDNVFFEAYIPARQR
jgi:glycerophosphoryl diester phosphodiesterase